MEIKTVSFQEYTQLFYKTLPQGFIYQTTPIQLYNLKQVADFLITPTTLIKAEFNFVVHLTHGYFEQQVNHEIKKVKAGNMLFVGYGEAVSLLKVSKDIDGFFIIFENRTLNQLLEHKALLKLFVINSLISLNLEVHNWIDSITKLLYQEVNSNQPDENVCLSLLQAVLFKVLSESKFDKEFNKSFEIAIKFREFAYMHFITQKQVLFYSKQIGVSENYMNRCVKKVFGKSAKEMLTEISILQALHDLRDLSKSVSEVAYELNYTDPSYFGRIFKQIIGFTPSQYRHCLMHDLSG